MILFISSDGTDCSLHLVNISELNTAFARWRIGSGTGQFNVVVDRADFQTRELEAWSRDTGALLRRYVATLEAAVKRDVTTRVVLYVTKPR